MNKNPLSQLVSVAYGNSGTGGEQKTDSSLFRPGKDYATSGGGNRMKKGRLAVNG
jgi:hypothetical protein